MTSEQNIRRMLVRPVDAGVFSFPCFLLVFQEDLVPLVNQLLFTLDVFEHVVGFWNSHVIGKYFGILLVKFEDAG